MSVPQLLAGEQCSTKPNKLAQQSPSCRSLA